MNYRVFIKRNLFFVSCNKLKIKWGVNMLMNYLREGIITFLYLTPVAAIILCAFIGIKFLLKRRFEFIPMKILCEFGWILTVLAILKITGIIGGDFNTTSILNGDVYFSYSIFQEGLSMATLLNITLFIPFGFLSPIVFSELQHKRIYGVLIGVIFSVVIEFLQTFTGRFVQLDDMLMNTLGTIIGYEIWIIISRIKSKPKLRVK